MARLNYSYGELLIMIITATSFDIILNLLHVFFLYLVGVNVLSALSNFFQSTKSACAVKKSIELGKRWSR